MNYLCPLCKSSLTKAKYHSVLHIQKEKEKIQKAGLDKLSKELQAQQNTAAILKKQLKSSKEQAKKNALEARKQGASDEKKRSERLLKGQASKVKKLQERIKMLEKGTTPQEIGLADETILFNRLKKEFPADVIQHTGKGGDILQTVQFNKINAGIIIYECKHTDKISSDHVRQTALAKKTRQADFGILVTTGTRKGFSGLAEESGILIVAQSGVMTLAVLCRDGLISMAKQKLDAQQRENAAKRLMDYVTSPICKTPLEQSIQATEKAHNNLIKEIKVHFGDWKDRSALYQTINHDISHVRTNIDRVLDGNIPLPLVKPKLELLSLPSN